MNHSGLRQQKIRASERLSRSASLSTQDEKFLSALKETCFGADAVIRPTSQPGILLSGWCARISTGSEQRRQFISFVLPGDCFGVHAAPCAADDLPIVALTPITLADGLPLQRLIRMRPPAHLGLVQACEKAMFLDQECLLSQIVRLGQHTACARVAHLLLELNDRLAAVGMANSACFTLPVSQAQLAEAAGLSAVHFHRTLTLLRDEGLVILRGREVVLPSISELALRAQLTSMNAAARSVRARR